jgi:hypothetical protein
MITIMEIGANGTVTMKDRYAEMLALSERAAIKRKQRDREFEAQALAAARKAAAESASFVAAQRVRPVNGLIKAEGASRGSQVDVRA